MRFRREERLKSWSAIGRMFKEGQSFGQYPLRFVWLPVEPENTSFPAQFTVSVPKKKFKKAVDRNRLRRQIREAYRLNKQLLYRNLDPSQKVYALMVIYVAKETVEYTEIETNMHRGLRRLGKILRDQQNQPTQKEE
ncbi:Ribonuclease P protein component [Haliscomenobacter hydrossis DSM 1100]|uniref:Ribonuclease P protein component n=1 Tax=Haliscomenobacter hydrossis (strain ATCC 27775 / DSM 1100 / LMG 10767 / O) TaxID=760192 RepID=F4L200_HALH1|nr:Ribonuclease P protein component [Haliscomenobacter hydrossis DSM 1100]